MRTNLGRALRWTALGGILALFIIASFLAQGDGRSSRIRRAANPSTPLPSAEIPQAAPAPVSSHPQATLLEEARKKLASVKPILPSRPGRADLYHMRDGAVTASFTTRGVEMSLGDSPLRWGVESAREVVPQAGGKLPGHHNDLVGPQEEWRKELPMYSNLTYRDIHPGIDLVIEAREHGFEYTLHVAPRASQENLRFGYQGAQEIRAVDLGAALEISVGGRTIRESGIVCYQPAADGNRPVQARFASVVGDDAHHWTYAIEVANADPSLPLVIDPGVDWWSYVGTSVDDGLQAVTVDSSGAIYTAGWKGAGSENFYLAKFNPSTNSLAWQTEQGTPGRDIAYGIVESGGYLYVAGESSDQAVVTKFSAASGTLLWNAQLGGSGSDVAYSISMDSGNLFVTGRTTSDDFTPLPNSYDSVFNGGTDAFVAKLNTSGSVLWSTYLGAAGYDAGMAVKATAGKVYVVGNTKRNIWVPSDLPVVKASQPTRPSTDTTGDVFIAQFQDSNAAPTLAWCTYYGGSADDQAYGVAVDVGNQVLVAGMTQSTNLPVTAGAYQTTGDTDGNGFIARFSPPNQVSTDTRTWSTYLGGSLYESIQGIGVTGSTVLVVGHTDSTDLPKKRWFQENQGGRDVFVAGLDPAQTGAAQLLWMSYLGGDAADEALGMFVPSGSPQVFYVAGKTTSTNLVPQLSGTYGLSAVSTYQGGASDGFVAKIHAFNPQRPSIPKLVAGAVVSNPPATNDPTPTFVIRAQKDVTVQLRVASSVQGTTASYTGPDVDGLYDYTVAVTAALTDGQYDFYARAIDGSYQSLDSPKYTLKIDTTLPIVTPVSPGAWTNAITPTIQAALSDGSGSGIDTTMTKIFVDSVDVTSQATVTESSIQWTPTANYANSTTHTVHVDTVDKVGNVGAGVNWSFTIDTGAPGALIKINNDDDAVAGSSVTLTLTGSYEGAPLTHLRVKNAPLGDSDPWETLSSVSGSPYTTTKPWTLTSGDGIRTVYLQFKDAAGNMATVLDSILVDSQPPSGTMTINGGASHTSSLQVTLNPNDGGSGAAWMHFANPNSPWSEWVSFATSHTWSLAGGEDGERTVHAQFKDAAGNVSTAAILDTIIVDTVAPQISNVSLSPSIFSPNGDGQKDETSFLYTLQDFGVNSGTIYVTVKIYDGAGTLIRTLVNQEARAPGSLSESWDGKNDASNTAADGLYTVKIDAMDLVGNSAPQESDTVAVDTQAPASPALTAPASAAVLNTATPLLTWSLSEGQIQNFDLHVDSGSAFVGPITQTWTGYDPIDATNFKRQTSPLNDGSYIWRVRARDQAGNRSAWSATRTFTIQVNDPPVISLASAAPNPFSPNNDGIKDSVTLNYTLSEPAKVTIEVYSQSNSLVRTLLDNQDRPAGANADSWDGKEDGAGVLPDGIYKFKIVAVDVDDASAQQWVGNVNLDNTPPASPTAPTLASESNSADPSDNITNDNTPTFTGTTEPDWKVELYSGPTKMGEATANATGQYTVTASTVEDGDNLFKVTITDKAGNSSGYSTPTLIKIDTAVPNAPGSVTYPATSTTGTYLITWPSAIDSGNAGISSYHLQRNEISVASGITGTSWQESGAQEGSYVYHVRAVDKAGNVGGWSTNTNQVEVDKTAPAGSIQINDGAAYAVVTAVTVVNYVSGATEMKFGTEWEPFAQTKAWTLPGPDGENTVSASFRDAAGNELSASDTILLDTQAPTGLITINDGADFTKDLVVTLTLNVTGATQMKFGSEWEPLAGSKAITLSAGDGVKTIIGTFRDEAGNEFQTGDGIVLDQTAPIVTIEGPAASNAQEITVTVTFSETVQGLVTNPNPLELVAQGVTGASVTSTTVVQNKTVTLVINTGSGDGSLILKINEGITDLAGNPLAPVVGPSCTIDKGSPQISNLSISLPAFNPDNDFTTISFHLSEEAKVTVKIGESVLWDKVLKAAGPHSLKYYASGAADGPYALKIEAVDAVGNAAIPAVGTIVVDTVPPSEPQLLSPANGSALQTSQVALEWSGSSDSVSYDLTLNSAAYSVATSSKFFGALAAGTYSWSVRAKDAAGNSSAWSPTFIFTIQLGIQNSELPSGSNSTSYSASINATGTGPFLFAVTAGTFPPGLTLSPTSGAIGGIPSAPGTYTFTITVTDANGSTVSQTYKITIDGVLTPLSIDWNSPLPIASQGNSYAAFLQASGGKRPYTWGSIGSLPPGLELEASSGLLHGTPIVAGNYSFDALVKDADGVVVTKPLELQVLPANESIDLRAAYPAVDKMVRLPVVVVKAKFSTSFFSTGEGIVWSLSSGKLPEGMTLATDGRISGIPAMEETVFFTLQAINSNDVRASIAVRADVGTNDSSELRWLLSSNAPQGKVGQAYSYTLVAAGTNTYYLWSGTELPPGLSMDGSTGEIVGTPSEAGSWVVAISAKDAADQEITVGLPLVVAGEDAVPPAEESIQPSAEVPSGGGGGGCGLVGLDALLVLAILTLRRRRKESIR